MLSVKIYIPYLFERMSRLLLISSPERRGIYSRVAFIVYILVNCQNSGRGQSKRAHAADDRSDEAMVSQVERNAASNVCFFCAVAIYHTMHSHAGTWALADVHIDPSPHPMKVI